METETTTTTETATPTAAPAISVEAEKLRVAEGMLAELQAQNKTLLESHQKAMEPLRAQLKTKMEAAPEIVKVRFKDRDLDKDPVATMAELDSELGHFEAMKTAANADAEKRVREYAEKLKKQFGFSAPELDKLAPAATATTASTPTAGAKPNPKDKPGDPADLNNLTALNLQQFASITADSNKMASYLEAKKQAAMAAKDV
jgi:hypothetical protein